MTMFRRHKRPTSPCRVNMHPHTKLLTNISNAVKRISRAQHSGSYSDEEKKKTMFLFSNVLDFGTI